jgi:hypothetical protein
MELILSRHLVEDINKASSQHFLLLMGSGQENITVEHVNKNTIKEKQDRFTSPLFSH